MEFVKRRVRQLYPDMSEADLKNAATGLYWWLCSYNKGLRGRI